MSQVHMHLPHDDRAAWMALWRLGAPVALQSLLAAALAFVDTVMVGAVGPAALGGVGVVGRCYFVLFMVLAGLSSGVGVLAAQYAGAGRRRALRGPAAVAAAFALLLAVPVALAAGLHAGDIAGLLTPDAEVAEQAAIFLRWSALFAPQTALLAIVAAVLRGTGNTRAPLIAGLWALALNTLLNCLFINGHLGMPALGVAGAALSTTVARCVELIWLLLALRAGPLWRLHRAVRRSDLALVMRSSLPLMFKEVGWAGGMLASTLIVSRMGALPLAAYHLALPVENIMISLVVGAAVATGILLGHALGREDFAPAYEAARRLLRIVSLKAFYIGLLLAVLVLALRWLGWLRGALDPALHDLALDALAAICVGFGAKAHNTMVSVGILRAGSDGKWMMWVDLFSMWAVNVPLVALAALVWHWPLWAVVGVVALEEVLKVAVFRHRVNSGRWVQRIAR